METDNCLIVSVCAVINMVYYYYSLDLGGGAYRQQWKNRPPATQTLKGSVIHVRGAGIVTRIMEVRVIVCDSLFF